MRLVLMGLGWLSVGLLAWTVVLTFQVWGGESITRGGLILIVATAMVSLVTHILGTLRLWARG